MYLFNLDFIHRRAAASGPDWRVGATPGQRGSRDILNYLERSNSAEEQFATGCGRPYKVL
jgi:hypothetical protein